jgi:hypothetical protein
LIAYDHICDLARTSEDKFIFIGGDAVHHNGELRPNQHLPLPKFITPSPFEAPTSHSFCLGTIFEPIQSSTLASLRNYKTTPFYELDPLMNVSLPDALTTVSKMQHFDASPDVLVIIAHDANLLDVLPFYLKGELTGWEKREMEDNLKAVGAWRFLKDFGKAIELLGAEGKSGLMVFW